MQLSGKELVVVSSCRSSWSFLLLSHTNRSMEHIFANNRDWVRESLSEDPDAYRRFAKSQAPKYLYIGCSDSRVPAQNMMVSLNAVLSREGDTLRANDELLDRFDDRALELADLLQTGP